MARLYHGIEKSAREGEADGNVDGVEGFRGGGEEGAG